ncbi:MAG: peptide-binding protein [Candidatus Thiodiazotropha taylori]|nr:peptide-binding protein [Candidatus Thiodiazotropha taylori]MCG8050637.1 peptide-binding protein [Candidatus Thiodiazotropha taylori]MCG8070693.1 peptide-binding protein [Candidatus Thiodiazotropha taylori]MCW4312456.1 peptide-binding protein [Candidatus Thiodiazotropha taylori]MCW4323225.1 peptide-binding protein [Candidatus Thiodiazotropha taylori]
MQRRLNGRDILYFGGLAVVLITIILAMYMVDRQWQKMAQMEQLMREQAADIRNIGMQLRTLGRQVESGVNLTSQTPTDEGPVPAAFERAYQATQQDDYAEGDWLVRAFGVNLKSLTPFISEDVYASTVQGYILESLLVRNADTLEWEGLLARQWEVSDDGLTFVFKLREGLRFSDGKPLTAEDVAFTFNFIMNPAIQAPRERAYYAKIKSVEALDKLTVRFQFAEPYFNALALAGGISVMPKHFYEPYLEEPNSYNQSKGLLLGSGPYRLEDPRNWSPDKGIIELQRNPRYWGSVQPAYNRLLWRIIENDSARLTTFRNGEIDTYVSRPREYKQLVEDKDLAKKAERWEYMSPIAGYSYIGWNQQRGDKPTRFADTRVRQAMTYLIDRERINKEIYLGYADVAMSPFTGSSKQHNPDLLPRDYDQNRAMALLNEAGYADRDGDGILEDESGAPFEFDLVYFQANEDTGRMVLFLKDLMARVGILLQPKPTEWSVMIDLMKKRDFDAITLGWTSGLETDLYQMFHSSQIADAGNNFIGYRNEKLDQLIDEARATVDEEKRMPLWQAAERELYNDQPYTFLKRSQSLVFIDRRIRNVLQTKLGLNLNSLPVETYVPADQHRYNQ